MTKENKAIWLTPPSTEENPQCPPSTLGMICMRDITSKTFITPPFNVKRISAKLQNYFKRYDKLNHVKLVIFASASYTKSLASLLGHSRPQYFDLSLNDLLYTPGCIRAIL